MIRRRQRRRTGPDTSGLRFAKPQPVSRAERNAPRNRRMRDDRFGVLKRAAGRCEFRCVLAGEPIEVHHLLGGADRRVFESQYTEAGICEACHGRCNASPAWAREQGLAFARRMAAEAQAARDGDGVAGFTFTAELLESKIALAAAQARPVGDVRHG